MIISNTDSTSRAQLWLCVWVQRGNSVTYVIMQQCIFPYMTNVNLRCNISFQLSLANTLTHYVDDCWQLEGCAYLDVPCWKILECLHSKLIKVLHYWLGSLQNYHTALEYIQIYQAIDLHRSFNQHMTMALWVICWWLLLLVAFVAATTSSPLCPTIVSSWICECFTNLFSCRPSQKLMSSSACWFGMGFIEALFKCCQPGRTWAFELTTKV
jgi:hypothetical protein